MSKSPLNDALNALQGKGEQSKLPLTGNKAKPAWQNIPGGPSGKGSVKKTFAPNTAVGSKRTYKPQGQSGR